MYAIMTVTGQDHTGIIAAVTSALARQNINILDVSQTLMDRWFTMILRVEFDEATRGIAAIQNEMAAVEREQCLTIRVQSEALFSAVNEI
ncbi:ACT domain-containing protein [Corynebacterium sp. zg-331]|uniref:ACT domain-containing protein n=1 Tax=unclassified Corynebacterium TaxID=2624378 RepID=UPI00128BFE5C|nr:MULTISPECIES: ACT domain-containing protein [unclassified Corynebacterium]MBC3185534.1 ACT domain-containing protein [Corynebacterium sp. zg-331]MPV52028.1 ACT domain-containing protein [Corynebacterium sp. zg331]